MCTLLTAVISIPPVGVLVLALGFLAACILCAPVASKLVHERMLRRLSLEGARVVSHPWTLSGLELLREGWRGEVAFESRGLGGGHPGHVRLRAEFAGRSVRPDAVPAPVGTEAPIRTGDPIFDQMIRVSGDPAVAGKLLVPEMRERLLALYRMGGQVTALGTESLEIRGPLLSRPEDLRRFLELCEAIVRGAILAVQR